ncbi:S1 RNA-binding domain-containing protein [Streptosporangium canum]|uniref:S1 RNA-binding domain-containing protein n=1 Tax=Streptosporangium canum TaxID=324952 RepID=UPI0033A28C71
MIGVFVRVSEGVEGLVPISDFGDRGGGSTECVLQIDGEVVVEVVDITFDKRRVTLSLRRAGDRSQDAPLLR